MDKIVVFGISEEAELALYYFNENKEYDIAAFTVNAEFIGKEEFMGKKVVPFENIQKQYPPHEYKMFIAVGYSAVNKNRERIYNEAKAKGYKLVNCISKKAIIASNVDIGDNCFIFELNNIQPYVKIGNNVTLWSGNHIGHHTAIEDHCFLTSHVVVSGGVRIGEKSFIGVNATIRDHIEIKPECVIGMSAIITRSTVEKGLYKVSGTRATEITTDQLKKI